MATEKLTDIELDSIKLLETKPRCLAKDTGYTQEDDIETGCGLVRVLVRGDRTKPAILTFHDIGLNSTTCFQGFFNYPDMEPILRHFCVYNINAPGQHEGALTLPEGLGFTAEPGANNNYTYPSMEELADTLLPVMQYYELKRFIGFGVGAGANVIARFALNYPDKVEGAVLINCSASKSSWTEWGYQKLNSYHLRRGNLTAGVEEYLLWHWFGRKTISSNRDLFHVYKECVKAINPQNLGHFIESYIQRSDLNIVREVDPNKKRTARNFRCPVMLIGGDYSPHLDDTITMNTRIDPEMCQWMKFESGGMVQEEVPGKLCEAFRLYLQGMGYVATLSQTRIVETRTHLSHSNVPPPAPPTMQPEQQPEKQPEIVEDALC